MPRMIADFLSATPRWRFDVRGSTTFTRYAER